MEKQRVLFSTKEIARLALFTAAAVVGRMMFQFIPNVQPMTDIFLLVTIYENLRSGLVVSLMSVIVTSIYLGMGLWTISQILSYSVIIIIVYLLSRNRWFKKSLLLQAVFAFFAGFLYGFVISIVESQIYGIKVFLPYYAAGLSFDFMHAVGNAAFYFLLAPLFSGKNRSHFKLS